MELSSFATWTRIMTKHRCLRSIDNSGGVGVANGEVLADSWRMRHLCSLPDQLDADGLTLVYQGSGGEEEVPNKFRYGACWRSSSCTATLGVPAGQVASREGTATCECYEPFTQPHSSGKGTPQYCGGCDEYLLSRHIHKIMWGLSTCISKSWSTI